MKFVLLILCLLSLPGFGQEDDEAVIQELEADRKRQTEAAVQIDQAHEKIKNQVLSFPEEMRKLGHESLTAASLWDDKVIHLVRNTIKQNAIHKKDPEQIKAAILKQSEGSFFHGYLSNSPKLMSALVDLIRDEQALSSVLGIFLRKEDLKIYLLIWIGFMIQSWLFKKIFFNPGWPIFRKKVLGFVVGLAFSMMSIGTFYMMFHQELSPSVEIILHHWRRRNL